MDSCLRGSDEEGAGMTKDVWTWSGGKIARFPGPLISKHIPLQSRTQGLKRLAVILAMSSVILKAVSWPLWLMNG